MDYNACCSCCCCGGGEGRRQRNIYMYMIRVYITVSTGEESSSWEELRNLTVIIGCWQDDCPLASLPLLGYEVGLPTEQDGIRKNHVFKLQFRNHVYFFRADNEFSFARWELGINYFWQGDWRFITPAKPWWISVEFDGCITFVTGYKWLMF